MTSNQQSDDELLSFYYNFYFPSTQFSRSRTVEHEQGNTKLKHSVRIILLFLGHEMIA